MKKSFLKLAGLALAAALALGMSGCSSDSDSHEHTFAKEWTSDATTHWHAATCEHKAEVKDKAEHTFGEWTTTEQPSEEAEGKRERKCSDCQYLAEETIAKLDHVHAKGTFHRDEKTIYKHIKNVFSEGEAEEKRNSQILRLPNSDKPVKF